MSVNTWGRDQNAGGDAPAADAVGDLSGLTPHGFSFHGNGKEYFGIWIVNILLSIVTLGIYSAWAKVRTKRYFNGNTELAGHRFDYHAEPMQILKGRIIVVVVLIALNLLAQLHPLAPLAVFAVYMLILPWVIVRGLAFNANMTSYRNVRFHFDNTKMNAFTSFILWPFAAIFTLGGLIPFASRASARFLGNGHRFGDAKFSADPPLKPYYKGLGVTLLFIFAPIILAGAVIGGMATFGSVAEEIGIVGLGLIYLASILAYAALIFAFLIYGVYSRNNGINNLMLENGHRFKSTVKVLPFVWIMVSNFILIIITLTLFVPWARVRLARYLADNTTMYAADNLDNFIGQHAPGEGVTSGEFLDIEGIDFGF